MKKETKNKLIDFGVTFIRVCAYVQLALLIGKLINTVVAPWWVVFAPSLLIVGYFLFICFIACVNGVTEVFIEEKQNKADKQE